MKPLVAIVGRPNVGKSTLFNRLIGQSAAIVDDLPGVTRDRLYHDTSWQNYNYTLIDTGGIQWDQDDINISVAEQALIAIEEADVIVFVVDNNVGVTYEDEKIAKILYKNDTPVVLTVNKVDNLKKDISFEFYSLGLGEPIPISAIHGQNVGDLLDCIVSYIPEVDEEVDDGKVKIALIGKPNVGKSSLVNKLCSNNRLIVSDIAGTTRDAIDQDVKYFGKKYTLIDTAGIRRKSRISELVEKHTVLRSIRAVERANVVFIMINAQEGVSEQDKRVAGFAHDKGKPSVIIVNKWDLIEKDNKTMKAFEEDIRHELIFLTYAPVIFISALTGQRVTDLYEKADLVYDNSMRKISTAILNELLREIVSFTPPPSDKGKRLKINYITQIKAAPPTFVMFVNDVDLMHFSYLRHIENRFREAFDFTGTPVKFFVRNKKGE